MCGAIDLDGNHHVDVATSLQSSYRSTFRYLATTYDFTSYICLIQLKNSINAPEYQTTFWYTLCGYKVEFESQTIGNDICIINLSNKSSNLLTASNWVSECWMCSSWEIVKILPHVNALALISIQLIGTLVI